MMHRLQFLRWDIRFRVDSRAWHFATSIPGHMHISSTTRKRQNLIGTELLTKLLTKLSLIISSWRSIDRLATSPKMLITDFRK